MARPRLATNLRLISPGQLLFLFCLGYALWALSLGWSHSLLDFHGFRQTQTAMNVQYLLAGSSWIHYETPVLGAPWSIPYEFPLFQWIVAALVGVLDTPLVQTGRLVAAACFLLTLFPIFSINRSLGIRNDGRFVLPALVLVSPLYLFWSRAFLIESMALFLSVSFLALTVRAAIAPESKTIARLLVASLAGALAALVKVTTLLGFLPAAWVLWFWLSRSSDRASSRRKSRVVAAGALLAGLPLVAGAAWTSFADSVKEQNPLANGFITSRSMLAWNYGTLNQKLDWGEWASYLNRTTVETIGSVAALVASLALILFVPNQYRRAYLVALGLFLISPVLFTNLHFVHAYYPYANGIFLIAALASCLLGCGASGPKVGRAGFVLMGAILIAGPIEYSRGYATLQIQDHAPDGRLIEAVRQVVDSGEVVLIYGNDWSPELPFYLGRRAIMDRDNRDINGPVMHHALELLADQGRSLTAVLACHAARHDAALVHRATLRFGFSSTPAFTGSRCDLYARSAQ